MNNFFSPAEICENMVNGCNNKAKLPISKMLVLGIFAGVFIGFGAYGFTVITSGAGTGFEATFAKYIGAGVFPVGLMLVVICGAELFTGNNLMTLSLFKKEITVGAMLRNWGVVWMANLIGSVLLAWLMSQSGLYGEAMTAKAIGIAEAKCAIPLMPVIIRAIFCNMLVCLAVWMQSGAKDIIGKIFAIWFPIMLFVLSGFEHSVANMFFIPMGIFCGADVTWAQAFLNNILPVTLGNIIGGAVIIPACYHFTYAKKSAA
ncbi:formate/nitrite transporter family protein [Acetobacterium wieringae]|uniref:Formate/nitrite transporter family protein n=1 Tax=Acetobacterium wieringae TaxID=52694 RepID=A0A5D0WI65_9FIRM|nr:MULTISPECIES: formate/nitrite transporter family protein [Acetobacterium]MEA4805383.1 formate/nitrite transporter family protein [Acetobacterium wieringae]OXS26435.1 MAG: FdhC protein [Acetobacterium sp. MES1]TYC83889.1 formate/nitrite transporter family protein [Acetobacterium wieringae]UYO62218.1 formate/nitrite transporter family protein [Acetobacterium wieringae]VUZ26055.1 putative formate transporter 1 [Acetobacterium wieringae]